MNFVSLWFDFDTTFIQRVERRLYITTRHKRQGQEERQKARPKARDSDSEKDTGRLREAERDGERRRETERTVPVAKYWTPHDC